jgi:hypothetical protein
VDEERRRMKPLDRKLDFELNGSEPGPYQFEYVSQGLRRDFNLFCITSFFFVT